MYTFLKDATSYFGDDHLDFILGLQSFLSDCILDDSYMTVEYFKIWINPEDRFDFDVNKLCPCIKEDSDSFPVARWARDMDSSASKDIKFLEEALEHIYNKEKTNRHIRNMSKGDYMKILICVDVQNDFCPGGSLAVDDGDKIIPVINRLSNSGKFDKVIASQDWHDKEHISFASTHGMIEFSTISNPDDFSLTTVWPDHCVKGTVGAELRPSLDQSNIQYIVRKGMDINVDSYSAFFDNNKQNKTGLCGIIQSSCEDVNPKDIEIYIVGIATDVCVLNTALDARILNWEGKVYVVEDACAGVTPEGTEDALARMDREGIIIVNSEEV